jgi:DNA-binding beta-propeller fold protein YncE
MIDVDAATMRHLWIVLSLLSVGCSGANELPADLVVAAVELDGQLAVLDGETGALLDLIDVSQETHHGTTRFRVHNVQAAPDGDLVWATAMARLGEGHTEPMPEQLVGVDPRSRAVVARIQLGNDIMASHVAIHGGRGFVTAYFVDNLIVVDLEARAIERTVALPIGTGPHGVRVTPDGGRLVIAGMFQGSAVVVDTTTWEVTPYPLPGRGVQAAVLPDGSAAYVTVYDTKQVARLDLEQGALALFDLPAGSAGPVQLYPTPDGAHLWVADQGLLDGDAAGDRLVRLDATTGAIDLTVTVAPGPHGVVVNDDGSLVWTTAVVDGVVQAIDATTGELRATTPVGAQPSGITSLFAGGAMP